MHERRLWESALVRDIARMLRETDAKSVFDDLVSEGGLEFATEIMTRAKQENVRRGYCAGRS